MQSTLKEYDLWSLPPRDYRAFAKLELPACYICVVRDVDSDCYRIDKTDYPSRFIDQVLAEREGDFGIELVAIVQTSGLDAVASFLLERYDATLGEEWMSLDSYQLQALRNSVLQINAYHSQYLSSQQNRDAQIGAGAIGPLTSVREAANVVGKSEQVTLKRLRSSSVAAERPAQARTRRRIRTRSELWNEDLPVEDAGFRQRIDDKINHLMVNHPGLVIAILVLVLLIALSQADPSNPFPTRIR